MITIKNTFLLFSSFAVLIILTSCGTANPSSTQNPDLLQSSNTPIATTQTQQPTNNKDTTTSRKEWKQPPDMQIDTQKTYLAKVSTTLGNFTIQLYAKDAPLTVNNFVFLARQGFYNGVIFHRVIESFMIQTGDPDGNGTGGPGYSFADEVNKGYSYDIGTVAMANAGPDTNGSQFFICSGIQCSGLPQRYSIFGKVTEGLDVVKKIERVPVQASANSIENSSPIDKIVINSVIIEENK